MTSPTSQEQQSGFTPGPWTPRGGGHSIAGPGNDKDRADMMDWCSGIDCIAPFTENEHGNYERIEEQPVAKAFGRTLEEAQANARRISQCVNSHDELLAVLRDMVEWLDDGNRVLSDSCADDVLRARAAIAKATGEAA